MGYWLLKGVWWGGGGAVMHTYGLEFFSKTINVIEFDLYFSLFFKSVKYKFLDLHGLKLIRCKFRLFSN